MERVFSSSSQEFILAGFMVGETRTVASQLSEIFCSSVAPVTYFEVAHLVLVGFFGSKMLRDLQVLIADFTLLNLISCTSVKFQILSFRINSRSSLVLSNKFGINLPKKH